MIILFLGLIMAVMGDSQLFSTDNFTTKEGKNLQIIFIKHGSLLLDFEGKKIYIDPVSEYADYSRLPKADVILITHEHADHLDPKAIGELKTSATKLIINGSSWEKLREGIVMKNGDKLSPEPWIGLEAVPAYNTTPDRKKFHPKGRDNGYVLSLGGTRIYIAGDTEDIPEMQQLKNIDIAFLPVNQPYTMTVDQAVHAVKIIQPQIFYPYHYGNTEIGKLKEALSDDKRIEVRIRALQ